MRSITMLYRLGKLTVTYRRPILIVWVALLIAAAPFATRVASQLEAGYGDINSEAARALKVARQELGAALPPPHSAWTKVVKRCAKD
ncbi:MAG: hypothetical protein Q8O40_00860 [Chloroflexota bacterium]|nr:hypothetical protein [Chloroflexota bacterium]